jgi:rhodanese-related sulfurtransferase
MIPVDTEQVKVFKDSEADIPIINVLDEDAYQKAHIPTSINVPLQSSDFVEQVGAVTESKNAPVVVYCANEQCDASPKAARKLEDAGFDKVYDYEGGVEAWKASGLPLEGAQA